jgi:hypothetical protein
MNNITITSALLRKHGACRDEVARFAEQYPCHRQRGDSTAIARAGIRRDLGSASAAQSASMRLCSRLRSRRHPSMGCAQSGARLS